MSEWDAFPVAPTPQTDDWSAFPAAPSQPRGNLASTIGGAALAGYNSPLGQDLVKAFPTGLAKGATALAGLPATVMDTIGLPGDIKALYSDLAGGTATQGNAAREGTPISNVAGPQALQGYIEQATGPFYKPQTAVGQGLDTLGQFAPAAAGGLEGLASRFMTRAVAPAAVSEAAGQLTSGTPLEPYARIGGALAGGIAGGVREAAAARAALPARPSTAELFDNASANYQNPAIAAMRANPAYGDSFANIITNDLRNQHFDPLDPGVNQVYNLVGALRQPRLGPQTTITELDTVRQRLRDVAKQGGPGQAAAQVAIKGIDNAIEALPASGYVTAGNPQAAVNALTAARGEYSAAKKSELIDSMINQAQNSASSTHSGGNLQNLIYQQVRNKLNEQERAAVKSRPGPLSGLTDQQMQALRDVLPASTGPAQAARVVGNLLGGGGGLGGMFSFLAGEHLLGPAGAALPLVGAVLKQAGARNAVNRLNAVRDLIATSAPSYGAANAAAYQQALANSGMLGTLINNPQALARSGVLSGLSQLPQFQANQR